MVRLEFGFLRALTLLIKPNTGLGRRKTSLLDQNYFFLCQIVMLLIIVFTVCSSKFCPNINFNSSPLLSFTSVLLCPILIVSYSLLISYPKFPYNMHLNPTLIIYPFLSYPYYILYPTLIISILPYPYYIHLYPTIIISIYILPLLYIHLYPTLIISISILLLLHLSLFYPYYI